MKKYRLTEETNDNGLHRIEALIAGPWGPAGTKGGWLASEANLSHEGSCWVAQNAHVAGDARVSGNAWVRGDARVYVNARVYGRAWVYGDALVAENAQVEENARVYGDAQVLGNAQVYGKAVVQFNALVKGNARVARSSDYLCLGPLGSRQAMLTVYRTAEGLEAATGCFVGSLEKLLVAARKTHAQTPQYWRDYLRAVTYAREQLEEAMAQAFAEALEKEETLEKRRNRND